MSYNFQVGDDVVFIDDGHEWETDDDTPPITLHHKQIYRVTEVGKDDWFNSGVYLCLAGFTLDDKFDAQDFRPLIKTDISLFQAMLVPTDKRIDA
jgi:hypothetical protein